MSALLGAAILAFALFPDRAGGQGVFQDDFESPNKSWQVVGGDAPHRIAVHQRTHGQAHSGEWCEQLQIEAGNGTEILLRYEIGKAPAISELEPRLWVRADRTGMQLSAHVVFPRSKDLRTGSPLATLVRGTIYDHSSVGRWKELIVSQFPLLIERQARLLRAELQRDVDTREAFVDYLLLNVYGGTGVTNLLIDELQIPGHLNRLPDATPATNPLTPVSKRTERLPPLEEPAALRVRLSGSILLVNDKPFFVRMVEHRGEPLAFLSRLGINTVRLATLPTSDILAQAAQTGMWLVCPPPGTGAADPIAAIPTEIGPEFDCVLVWDMGHELARRDLDSFKSWAEAIRRADSRMKRPMTCDVDDQLRTFTRYVDVLTTRRSTLAGGFELAAYGSWLRGRMSLARPGVSVWATVETQFPLSMEQQRDAMAGKPLGAITAQDEQIRLLTYAAVAAGARGLIFESRSRLDADDQQTKTRAASLELLNLELALIEPWGAAGSYLSSVTASDPQVTGAVLQSQRERVVLPLWMGPGSQFVPGQSAGNSISFVIPGVPEDHRAYEVTPAGVKPLATRRVTGGTAVTLDEFGLTSILLVTQNPVAVTELSTRLARGRERAARLQRELAEQKFRQVEDVDRYIANNAAGLPQIQGWFRSARISLEKSDAAVGSGDFEAAYLNAQRAMRPLRLIERRHWEAHARALGSVIASPFAGSFATLPEHLALVRRVQGGRFDRNQLPGGDAEGLDTMLQLGWRNLMHPQPGIETRAELTPEAAKSGTLGLRLQVQPSIPSQPPAIVESPPLWITTPALSVMPGTVYRIQAAVRIPAQIAGSSDGLLIVDSLGGEAMAERVRSTSGWKEVTLYRVASGATPLAVSFVLTGLGTADIDDIRIEPLLSSGSTRPNQSVLFNAGDLRRLPAVR